MVYRNCASFLWIVCALGCGSTPAVVEPPPAAPSAEASPLPERTVPIPNAATPLRGLLTGGQPSAEHFKTAAEAGYATVINLRAGDEPGTRDERPEVEALGMAYVSIPVSGADGISVANATALAGALGASSGPVLLHCGTGNRAGALLAMKAFHIDGVPADAALELGKRAGLTTLEPVVKERLVR